jgi:hypothetical protein
MKINKAKKDKSSGNVRVKGSVLRSPPVLFLIFMNNLDVQIALLTSV